MRDRERRWHMDDVPGYEAQNHLFAPLNFRPKERLISTMLAAQPDHEQHFGGFCRHQAKAQGRSTHAGCSGLRQVRHGGGQSKKR
jgi:hypothetical protein